MLNPNLAWMTGESGGTIAQWYELKAMSPVSQGREHRTARDVFVAGRLFPRAQWLVVSGRPTAPSVVQAYLDRHEYGDVYGLLQSAVVPDTKWFVQDLRADGLHAEIADSVDILYERVVNQTIFDGEPGKHKMRAKDYARKFADADAEYARLLSLLLRSLRLMTSVNADARN
jgi:hypothetical protein